jgi:hypothetical protein
MDRISFEAAIIVLLAGILWSLWNVNDRLEKILKRLNAQK